MAILKWNNGANSFDYEAWTGTANLGVNLARQKNAPLDISGVFSSVKDMLYYVTEGRYPSGGTGVSAKVKDMTKYPYLGQIIALVDPETEEVQIFYIQTAEYNASLSTDTEVFDHYFAEVGKATVGDNDSIVLDEENGILSLKDFGQRYYKYNTSTKSYDTSATEGWIDNLEPAIVDGKLIWREKNTTTIDGISAQVAANTTAIAANKKAIESNDSDISALDGRLTTAESDIDAVEGRATALEGRMTTAESDIDALESGKADKATTLAGYGITNAYTKTETDSAIDTAISGLGSVFELKQVYTEAEFNALGGAVPSGWEAGDVALVKYTDGTGNDASKEYVVVDNGSTLVFELLGDPHGVDSLKAQVAANKKAIESNDSDISALDGRLTTAESDINAVEGRLTTAESDIDAVEGRATALEGRMTTAESDIDAVEVRATALEGRMTTAESDIDAVEGRATALETTVGDSTKGLVKKVADNATAIAANKKAIESNDSDISALDGRATELEGRATELEGKATVLDGRATALEETISAGKVNSASTADVANSTTGTLTLFNKTFNGSTDVTVSETDVVNIATAAKAGIVKSSSGTDKVSVATDGTMSISKASKATTADKVANKLTVGSETFDGSSPVTVTLEKLGFDSTAYATKDQGTKADSAVQTISVAGLTASGNTATITKDNLKTALGIGDLATKIEFNNLDAAAAKKAEDNTFSGSNTFSKPVTVATPTASGHATTKKYVDDEVTKINDELAKKLAAGDAMTFKGLLGVGGNVTSLPTVNVHNGDTYKVISDGTYAEQAASVGDMFIAVVTGEGETASIEWALIPSGDDGNVYHDTLTTDAVVLAKDGKTIKTLANGTNGKILRIVNNKPAWDTETLTEVTSDDSSISVTKSGNSYDVAVAKVNANLIEQTAGDYFIFDCGSSTVNI